MTRRDTPAEAGLEFAIRQTEAHLGVQAAAAAPIRKRLRTLRLVDSHTVPTIGQPVLRDGQSVGAVTSAEYGWSVCAVLAFAWLPTDVNEGDEVNVSCAGTQHPAVVVADTQFDPQGESLRR
jgi:glycine cleavage system aminomethyltransferase T